MPIPAIVMGITAIVQAVAAAVNTGVQVAEMQNQEANQVELKKVQTDAINKQETNLRKANSVSAALEKINARKAIGEAKSQAVLQNSFAADALTEIGDKRRERETGKAIARAQA